MYTISAIVPRFTANQLLSVTDWRKYGSFRIDPREGQRVPDSGEQT